MTAKSALIERIESLTIPALSEYGAELVDIQFVHEHGQWVLRYFVDKAGGVTLDDCANLSDLLGRTLDASDAIPQAYSLEISSPGVNRPLKKIADFKRFLGSRSDITLYAPINGRRHFRAMLKNVTDQDVIVMEENVEYTIPLVAIAKAKLDPEIDI